MVSSSQLTQPTSNDNQPYFYMGVIKIVQRESLPTALLLLAERHAHLGISYNAKSHALVIMCQRHRDDIEMMQALNELAGLIPVSGLHQIAVTNRAGSDHFSYLLYNGAVYRLGNPLLPVRPRRLVIGVYRRRIASGVRGEGLGRVA